MMQQRRPVRLMITALVVSALLLGLAMAFISTRGSRGLPYHDAFAAGRADEWTSFGGTWQIAAGAMRNDSDERGAKLITGSPRWKDYSFRADVELLGEQGDAGLILRSGDEEQGVDAYRGFYVGLRSNDGSLIIGQADHRWIPLAQKSMPGGVHAFRWYHLEGAVQGCNISASAQELPAGEVESISFVSAHCPQTGRVGLRSHSSGGAWKNLSVLSLNTLESVTTSARPYVAPEAMAYAVDEPVTQPIAGRPDGGSLLPEANARQAFAASRSRKVESIGALRMVRTLDRLATVRGTVILTSPGLYVQDATGGVAIVTLQHLNLKVGDEVEVTGVVQAQDFSCVLRDATVRLLWAHSPAPPLAVIASQAATGAFDARFIEVDGSLLSQSEGPGSTTVLTLNSGDQSFHAVVQPARGDSTLRRLRKESILRLRGVCVVDPLYTRNLVPFVLLVSSSDDVEVLAGPPWWSLHNLAILGLLAISISLIAYLLYMRVRHWRLRAIVEERERIAHEMHDTLAQSFVGIGFQLQAISNSVPPDLPGINQQLDLACELVRHSHQEATRSLSTLRREFLESETLHSALYAFARRIVEHGAVDLRLDSVGEDTDTPYAIKDALFRIGQEAVANALRHAAPTRLTIRIEYTEEAVKMTVEDNGNGFDTTAELRGFGITGLRKRAAAISARVHIRSTVGAGTAVQIDAPLPPRLTWLKAGRHFLHEAREKRTNGKRPGRKENPYSYRR